ncbi:FkbM family methyltransferase [Mucilaginibacter ginkgonis]|uniref:FkbM family methyltransferase n=1 Tax=Mucilaginibacter ginkgonis TaxID=2682091 RepID=A0A6I4I4B4_9SPHI|nr:FkbM family methyltransferase [Mucilaginibacter ginkgonis]QQL48889.1 FkbM family methyltransferase [Mucilaginibacter ginkgonis]
MIDDTNFKALHSYSQNGEDMLLRAVIAQDLNGNRKGFFVDIGAHHPFRNSNTAFFYENGWTGINIEPTPQALKLFEDARSNDINLNVGIGEFRETRTLYCFEDSSLNTFDKTIADKRTEGVTGSANVDIYPLRDILDQHLPAGKNIDFISIDTAGLDIALLQSNDWDKYRPKYLLIEDVDSAGTVDVSEVYSFLHEHGYEQIYKTPRTLIFKER